MNENRIDNIEMWTEEILDLTKKNSLYEDFDGDRYEKLIFMAEDTKEIKVVQGLMRCLEYELPGMDQTIEDVLSMVDPLTYYNALFELAPKLLKTKNDRDVFLGLLSQAHGYKYNINEWNKIYTMGEKHLRKKDIENIILAFKEGNLDNEDSGSRYQKLYQLFQKLLKEKSEE